MGKNFIFFIKNFHRLDAVYLTVKSLRKFTDEKIIICNFFKENSNEYQQSDLDLFGEFSNIDLLFKKTRWNEGPGEYSPSNGYYYTEGLNTCYETLSGCNEKTIFLDENHFFLHNRILESARELNVAIAFYDWGHFHHFDGVSFSKYSPDCSFLVMDFKKIKHCFPLEETRDYCEPLISKLIVEKIENPNEIYILDKNQRSCPHTNNTSYMRQLIT